MALRVSRSGGVEIAGGFVTEFGIESDEARETITFYELPKLSLMGMP